MIKIDVLVPVFNEEAYLESCLLSINDFEVPDDVELMIYIIDGMSEDKSREIIETHYSNQMNIILLDNPKRIQSAALNKGIARGEGQYILRLDAHSSYPKNYLRLCLETMQRTKSSNVGGIVVTEPGSDSYSALIVQALTTHWFGVGNSGFRIGAEEGEANTVPYGFFDAEIFERIGSFDERLVRAQDYEFNCRIKENGGKIWLNPAIRISYKNQSSFFRFLKKQLYFEAPYNSYMWYLAPYTFNLRHSITGLFTFGFISGILLSKFSIFIEVIFLSVMALYGLLAIFSSFTQARKYKQKRHLLSLPFAFFSFHFIHGIGILYGLLLVLIKKSPVQK